MWLVLPVCLGAVLGGCGRRKTPSGRGLEAKTTLDALHGVVRRRVERGALARTDGFVYTVDVAQLALFAARAGDRTMYGRLTEMGRRLVRQDPSDPYTDGFVYWRLSEGSPPDASGTTEALRLAQAFWEGAERFQLDGDRRLAIAILDGYRRHQAEERGVWMIRNYFNLGTRSFATNSFLVDYAPDFVARVARETDDDRLRLVARRSYRLIRDAQTPTGLLYDVIQPELGTLWDDDQLVHFSPNDVVQVSNSATVAAQIVVGDPDTARGVLRFCLDRMPNLAHSYRGTSGDVVWSKRPGIEAWASLTQTAMALGDGDAVDQFYLFLESNAARIERIPDDAWLFVASELLLGLQAIVGTETPTPGGGSVDDSRAGRSP